MRTKDIMAEKRIAGGVGQAQEDADAETASEGYAGRFGGPVGSWFLERQSRCVLDLLAGLPAGSAILDVGGGHGQIAPGLVRAGYTVTIVGSSPAAGAHLPARMHGLPYRFEVGDLRALPYADQAFTAVTCFRLLPHSVDWRHLVSELCRVAARAVVVDYPSTRSVNHFADLLFAYKRKVERNTRPFELFRPSEIEGEFGRHRFAIAGRRPQFLLPMVLHRMLRARGLAAAAEMPGRLLGLTTYFGSPVIVRADRRRD